MTEQNSKNVIRPAYSKYWIAYFDLLGFKARVQGNLLPFLLGDYKKILNTVKSRTKPWESYGLKAKWFSDTFLFYCKVEQTGSLVMMEQCSRLFFRSCIRAHKPVVGCLALGDLYVDDLEDIMLGPGLIDAYETAERQDWIGLVVTDEVREQWRAQGRYKTYSRFMYTDYDVPQKGENPKRLFAYRTVTPNGKYDCLSHIVNMKNYVKNMGAKFEVIDKYERTEQFLGSSGNKNS